MLPQAPHRKARALIVEGGGMRGSFAGGVLAAMTQTYPAINFSLVVGVSAGSCDAAYYVTADESDSDLAMSRLNIWRQELVGRRLINFLNPLRGKPFLNQEYLVDRLFARKYRLRAEAFDEIKTQFYVVVSNLRTFVPEYVKATSSNILQLLKAATAIPIATSGKWTLFNNSYTDGGVLDPLPVEAVLRAGYRRLTVILNDPVGFRARQISKMVSFLSYPFNKDIRIRLHREYHQKYNRALEILHRPPAGVEVTLVAPEERAPAGLITTNERAVNRNIDMGLQAGFKAFERLKGKRWFWQR
ncbi:MAG: patatin-like phospholipase family protein [Spirochaetales bacterium]|nr:patatin-like phospholipase family protein [Spirochaetales bacterium]